MPLGSKPWQCLNQHHEKKKIFHVDNPPESPCVLPGIMIRQETEPGWALYVTFSPKGFPLRRPGIFSVFCCCSHEILNNDQRSALCFHLAQCPLNYGYFLTEKIWCFLAQTSFSLKEKRLWYQGKRTFIDFHLWGSPYHPGPLLPLPLANEYCVVLALKHSQLGTITEEQLLWWFCDIRMLVRVIY